MVIIYNNLWPPLFIKSVGVSPGPAEHPVFIFIIACFAVLLSITIALPITFPKHFLFFLKILYVLLLKVLNSIFLIYLQLLSLLLPLFDKHLFEINFQDSELFSLPKYDYVSKHSLTQNSFLFFGNIPLTFTCNIFFTCHYYSWSEPF